MEGAIVKKILNNNVVIALNNKEDYIIVGSGIGFDFKKDSVIPSERIEKIYVREDMKNNKTYEKVLGAIDSNIVGISEEIICTAERELDEKLNDEIHVSLPDHINFAINRIKNGFNIEDPFQHELKILYPKEYSIAVYAISLINERLHANLPEGEIGFICLHIKSAVSKGNIGQHIEYTKKISEIMDFIGKTIKRKMHRETLQYIRTLTHVDFMIERVKQGKPVNNPLLDTIKLKFPEEYSLAIKISIKIESLFNMKVPEDEIGYIAMHLKRLKDI